MADSRHCETCGLAVPADTDICPRDGTVLLDFAMPRAGLSEPPRQTSPGKAMQSLEDPTDGLVGLKIGEYELRQRIGVGGMGLVYDGIQPLIGKRVAVKVLRPELAAAEEQVARLLAEARAVNAIRHRGIVDIFGFGQVPDGRQYIIMEYLEGVALDAHLAEKGRLPVNEVLDILDEVLSALGAAHGAGVVHRDLKPSNVFLVKQPDGSRYVKLLDFGLAKVGMPAGRTAQTRTDMVVGTPEYMAPEQARGQPVGPMTDLYALGVVAFEMVTGRLPFTGSSPVDLLLKHVDARPPRPSDFLPGLPAALDAFILQMLTKDPEARPGSAEQLRRQLQRLRETLLAQAAASAPPPAPPRPEAALAPEPREPPRSPTPEVSAPPHRPATPAPTPPVPLPPGGASASRRLLLPVGLGTIGLVIVGGIMMALREPPPPVPAPVPPPVLAEVRPPPPTPPDPTPQPPPVAAVTADAGTPGTATAPPPDEPPHLTVPAVARVDPPEPQPVVQKRPSAPSQAVLQGRIRTFNRDLETSLQAGQKLSPAARPSLDRLRNRAAEATTPEERRKLSTELDSWEKLFLRRK